MRWVIAWLSAAFIAAYGFHAYSLLFPREAFGTVTLVRNGDTYIGTLKPGSAAERAGLKVGDRVVAVDGIRLVPLTELRGFTSNVPPGMATTWSIERDGQPLTLVMPPLGSGTAAPATALAVLTGGVSVALGVLIAWRRPKDAGALAGAYFLASLYNFGGAGAVDGAGAKMHALPFAFQALCWPAIISTQFTTISLFLFTSQVPRRMLSNRALAWALIPGAIMAAWMTPTVLRYSYWPEKLATQPFLDLYVYVVVGFGALYVVASLVLVGLSLRNATDRTERRRARIMLAGIAIGMAGNFWIAIEIIGAQLGIVWSPEAAQAFPVVGHFMIMVLPVSFAYVILRHRLFDLRIIVRLGLQYAVARGALLALIPLALALLVADVLRHGDLPVRQVIADRGWIYLTVAAASLVVFGQREQWMAALDRRFFRERYAAQQVLRHVVEVAGRAETLDEVADEVLARIDEALHPRMAALLVGAPGARHLSMAGTLRRQLPPLRTDSALVQIARVLAKPLKVSSDAGGMRRELPADDLAWLAAADAELLIPITLGERHRDVLLVLGPRLSEEPYSNEDLDLLSAIATSLALAERRAPAPAPVSTATVAAERVTLAARYQLEHLIGEGGMGAVWAGVDQQLDRPVAVKLLKRKAGDPGDEVTRFKREAQAAARFAHPNVVVVHDFGVDSDRPYLIMERLVGRTLRERMVSERRLAPASVAHIVTGAASGIAAAHERQLVHRDLKPENIFLCDNGSHPQVKILDFGIARSVAFDASAARTTGVGITGTLLYMAPEQLAGGKPAAAWDVWALSVIAYEMLAGAHPLRSTDVVGWIPALLAGLMTPLGTHLPEAPSEWQRLFERALSVDPAKRPATATAFAAEFSTIVSRS